MTVRAVWHDTVIAESDATVQVEGNHYFPPDAVRWEHLTPTEKHTICPWKGTASYYSVKVGTDTNDDAAWTYPEPKTKAENIRDHVAFWRGVEVTAG